MDNNLATVCIVIMGVVIVLLLAAILLLRVVRGSIFGLGMMVMRVVTEAKEEPASTPVVQAQSHPTINDLRAQAQSLDFDAAVAKHRAESPPPTVHPVPPPSAYPPATTPPDHDQGGGWPNP